MILSCFKCCNSLRTCDAGDINDNCLFRGMVNLQVNTDRSVMI